MRRFIERAIPGLTATLLLTACLDLRDIPEPPDAGQLFDDFGVGTVKNTDSDTSTLAEIGSDRVLAGNTESLLSKIYSNPFFLYGKWLIFLRVIMGL